MKTCTKCEVEKPLNEFGKHKRRKGGIDSWCRDCRRADNRARMKRWRAANPERATSQQKKDREKLAARYPDYHKRWYAEHPGLREAARLYMRRSRRDDPEAERARKRRYRERNAAAVAKREREKTYARRAKQPYSPELAVLMAELVTMPCVYCGATENITIDHVIPLSRGGKHEAANLAPACLPCNASKCNHLPSEWPGRQST